MQIHLTPAEWEARYESAKAELSALGNCPSFPEATKAALDALQGLYDAAEKNNRSKTVQHGLDQLLGEEANSWEITAAEAANRARLQAEAWEAVAAFRLTEPQLAELRESLAAQNAWRNRKDGLLEIARQSQSEKQNAERRATIAERALEPMTGEVGRGVTLRGGRNDWRAVSFDGRDLELRRRNSKGGIETRLVDALECYESYLTVNPGNLYAPEKVAELRAAREAAQEATAAEAVA